MRPYSDYGRAVFGFQIVGAASSSRVPARVVWRKFGRDLLESRVVLGSLKELNSLPDTPDIVRCRVSGIPFVADYGEAATGVSRTWTVSSDGMGLASREETTLAMSLYRGLDWQFMIGEMDSLSIPSGHIPPVPASRPLT